jgi:5-(aminomethyl)-3-furanmethanol phosphate kinase
VTASPPYSPARQLSSRPDICDVFVKLGGSILDDASSTAGLVPALVALSKEYRLVTLCGGGRVAKRIVSNQRKLGSDFLCSWRAGITSLDVHAGLLASHSPDFAVAVSVFEIADRLAKGKMAVLAPAAKIVSDLLMFPDYEVTTDSMGLYFASLLGARRYVVVSNVDGIYASTSSSCSSSEPLSSLTPEELESLPSSKLDRVFPAYFRRYPLPTVVVNGKYPVRMSDAIRGKHTVGTAIVS